MWYTLRMRKPIFIRPLTEDEQQTLQEGLRSSNAFVLRRCQILLASARGQTARVIAETLGCDDQTVRNVIHAFNTQGLAALTRRSSAPQRTPHAAFDPPRREQLRALLHQSPRTFGNPTSLWTLALAAEVAYAEGLTHRPSQWRKPFAAPWHVSASAGSGPNTGSPVPIPRISEKKTARPADGPRRDPSHLGPRL